MDELSLFGVGYGGSAYAGQVFLTMSTLQPGYDDDYLAKLVHHELSSLFFQQLPFPEKAWRDANPPGFRYADTDEDVLASISEPGAMKGEESLFESGFLAHYGQSTLENDFNVYAEMAMTEPERLKALARDYRRVRMKVGLLR